MSQHQSDDFWDLIEAVIGEAESVPGHRNCFPQGLTQYGQVTEQ
jgi:hypothetical protein